MSERHWTDYGNTEEDGLTIIRLVDENQALRKIVDGLMWICDSVETDNYMTKEERERLSLAKSELEKLKPTGGEGNDQA